MFPVLPPNFYKTPRKIQSNRENPLESYIERKVREYAKSRGVMSYKFTSPSRRSVPDVIFLPGRAQAFFIEFKRKGNKATAAQLREHTKLLNQGYQVFVIDSVEKGILLISNWLVMSEK